MRQSAWHPIAAVVALLVAVIFMVGSEGASSAQKRFTVAPTPKITGSLLVGAHLKATAGSWKPSGATLSYQWRRDGAAISKATAKTLRLTSTSIGHRITVTVTAKKAGYATLAKTSSRTLPVPKLKSFTTAPVPKVIGLPTFGQRLSASAGTWKPAPTKLTYAWSADGKTISGASSSTYTVASSNIGKKIRVTVTATRAGYSTKSKASSLTATVQPAEFAFHPAPTPIGDPEVGQSLQTHVDAWTPTPTSVTYQWTADGVPIAGATDD